MKMLVTAGIALTLAASACGGEATPTAVPETSVEAPLASARTDGLVVRSIPSEDPGPPFYARLGVQFWVDDGTLAIPFYRDPDCIPADFNLLDFFHFPGPDGPGAFACPILVKGRLQTEVDAPPTRFPLRVWMRGSDTPIWFVDWDAFQAEASDGVVTVADLRALSPRIGVATRFREFLQPRDENHRVRVWARGRLAEGGAPCTFHVADIDYEVRRIGIRFWKGRKGR